MGHAFEAIVAQKNRGSITWLGAGVLCLFLT
jgi:hypothetical protein